MTSLSFIPRDFQNLMIEHVIKTPRCALWAGMGTGKSSATLKSLDILSCAEDIYPALICAPLRVARSTWPEEGLKWSEFRHIGISAVIGTELERKLALKQSADIYTINYENLPWLLKYYGDKWPFKTVIADEATKLKSFRLRQGGSRTRALSRHAHTKIKRFIELTGTPSPNGLKDLWGQIWFLDAGQRLGRTYDAFRQRWFQQSFDGYSIIPLPFAQEQIQEKLKDICLSINSADYFDIKNPIVVPVYVDLPPLARKLYKGMEDKMFMEIEGNEIEAFNAGARTNKCLQIANGAAYLDNEDGDISSDKGWKIIHDEKIEALDEIIEKAGGTPVIVAYNFKSDLARLKKAFLKGRHLNTKKDEDDFKTGKIPILFLHPKSAGHGIDGFQYITNILVFFGLTWSLEDYQQIIERIGPVRQIQAGFNRNVFIYHIICQRTVDELVLKRLKTKREVQDILLEALKYRRDNG